MGNVRMPSQKFSEPLNDVPRAYLSGLNLLSAWPLLLMEAEAIANKLPSARAILTQIPDSPGVLGEHGGRPGRP